MSSSFGPVLEDEREPKKKRQARRRAKLSGYLVALRFEGARKRAWPLGRKGAKKPRLLAQRCLKGAEQPLSIP